MKLVLALLSVASVAALAPQQGLNRRAVLKTGAAFPAFLVGAGKARAADKKAAAPAKAAPLAAPEAGFAQSPTGLQSKELSRPDGMERLATNVLKAGDYIRVDYKLYVDGFGKTLVESTDKTGPVEFQIGTGAKQGSTGMKKVKDVVKIPAGLDEACIGQVVGLKQQLIIPASIGFGKEPVTTLSGATIPAGSTLYYEMRVRSRVFASIVGPGGVAQQENFLEVDQVAKLNAIMGVGQD